MDKTYPYVYIDTLEEMIEARHILEKTYKRANYKWDSENYFEHGARMVFVEPTEKEEVHTSVGLSELGYKEPDIMEEWTLEELRTGTTPASAQLRALVGTLNSKDVTWDI